jgi:hypothetical protein
MFTAYVDESGHDPQGELTVLAGFLGNEAQWNAFCPKWREALGPDRKALHMADLRWNTQATRRLLSRLGPIPQECNLDPIMAGVRFEDYRDLLDDDPSKLELGAYLVCMHVLTIQVLRAIPDDELLEIVFEEQNEYECYASKILSVAAATGPRTSDGRSKLAKWSFVPKGSTILTDPSDYFAFAIRQAWTKPASKKAAWSGPILQTGQGQGYGKILDRDEVRPIIRDIVNPLLNDLGE